MSGLIKRLRRIESSSGGRRINHPVTNWLRNPDGPEAADEIERLRKRCNPSKTVAIGDTIHYVSEPVFSEIERLQHELAEARGLLREAQEYALSLGFSSAPEFCTRIDALLRQINR